MLYLITNDSNYTTQKLGSFLFTDELTHLEWKLLPIDTPLKLIDTGFTHDNNINYIIKGQFYWSYFNFAQINMNPSLPRQSNAYFLGVVQTNLNLLKIISILKNKILIFL